MTRRSPGFGSRYKCPACDQTVALAGRLMYGPYAAHGACDVKCGICGEVMAKPQIGQSSKYAAWLYKPVHASCKQREMRTAFKAVIPTITEEEK